MAAVSRLSAFSVIAAVGVRNSAFGSTCLSLSAAERDLGEAAYSATDVTATLFGPSLERMPLLAQITGMSDDAIRGGLGRGVFFGRAKYNSSVSVCGGARK